jgi:hypothetical protein
VLSLWYDGTIRKHCKKLKRENKEQGNEKKNNDANDNGRVSTIDAKDFFIVYDNVVINITCHEISWVIDSGVSIHTIL